jgi:deoxycytidylate deaminase
MIINSGIDKIYYRSGYADELSKDMLQEGHIEVIHLGTKKQGEDS